MRLGLSLFLLLFVRCVSAQAILPYEINSHYLPADTAKVQLDMLEGGLKSGNFVGERLKPGDIIPDFTLYDLMGNPCRLSELLGQGKPVLLISMSYTCPRSRETAVDGLRFINRAYGKRINIRVIYTLEAHPIAPDVCPYSGEVINAPENIKDSVYFPQPKTYLERKKMAEELNKRFLIPVPILIDGPGNEYWKTFGPAPNHAYLLTPGGMIYRKYAWFQDAKTKTKTDVPLMLADSVLMRTDFSKFAWISVGKKAGSASLFVPDVKYYEIDIIDSKGKTVFKKEKVSAEEYHLEKIKLAPGSYGVLVKTENTRIYCLRYERK